MRHTLLVALLLVAGCREQSPPAPTAEQDLQLNEAEAMLNEMGKEEGPETNVPSPSNSSD